jgi:hypothetical protein
MRVGVLGPLYPDSFAENIGAGLRALGIETHRLELPLAHRRPRHRVGKAVRLAPRVFPALGQATQHTLIRRALSLELDLVISVDASWHPATIAALRRGGVRTCLWYPDAVANLGGGLVALSPYDALFFKEPVLVERFVRMLDLPAYYLPEACNPMWHNIPADADDGPCEADGHVIVAGNMYGTRVRTLRLLIDAGIPLLLYGKPIPPRFREPAITAVHTGRYVAKAEKARVFRRAAAVLNTMHPAEFDGVNVRLFEATGCGATVLTEHRPEVPALFEPGREILSYTSINELIDHAKRLTTEPGSARALGDAASARAHLEHTYAHRLTRLLEVIA